MTKKIMIFLLLSFGVLANQTQSRVHEYKKACKDGSMHGCISLATLYYTGDGVKQNAKKAKKLFEKGCKKKYVKACYNLGTLYKRGEFGIEKDIRRSRMFYSRSCELGYAQACDQYNLIREKLEVKGSGKNVTNSGYTYTTEIYGG
ncbi:MAG: tetratricopeptide repeat protein [Sulfurimonas sp.]|nr:tetratricopeptide repeat protein [Sulfurimonas sp.]MDQ7059851.1 tetratricopeptide repeat protein [Sulfurimonas sp.]